jgi:hypothetical protein
MAPLPTSIDVQLNVDMVMRAIDDVGNRLLPDEWIAVLKELQEQIHFRLETAKQYV